MSEELNVEMSARVKRAAVSNEKRLAEAFLRTVIAVRQELSIEEITQRLIQNPGGIDDYLDLENRMMAAANGRGIAVGRDSLAEALRRAYEDGARAALKDLDEFEITDEDELIVEKAATPKGLKVPAGLQPKKTSVGARLAFDLLNPLTVDFLKRYQFGLIKEISKETRKAIKAIVTDGFIRGMHPTVQARIIASVIGLTSRQANAVKNFIKLLSGKESEIRQVLQRALRDHRFDALIQAAAQGDKVLTVKEILKMAFQYFVRYLAYRSRTIARTETIRAANAGQQDLWKQALAEGIMDKSRTRRHWSVADDERLCPKCKEVPEMNPDGVEVDKPFDTPVGAMMLPPLHPNCRCGVVLRFKKRKKKPKPVAEGA